MHKARRKCWNATGWPAMLTNPCDWRPLFWQPWTTRMDDHWRFFFALDDAEGWDGDEYALNFGGGTSYAFLSTDELEGKFLFDCV